MSNFHFGVVLLAAGRSRRMRQSKLVLPWRGTSIIGHLVDLWRAAGANQVAVVCAADREDVTRELDRLGFEGNNRIMNQEPERGMFSSIQCSAKWPDWNPELTHLVIALGDQPHITAATVSALSVFAKAHANGICQPAFNGRAAHPVFLPRKDFEQLATTRAHDLREFLRTRSVALCEISDPGLAWDIDTPEDYRRLLGGG